MLAWLVVGLIAGWLTGKLMRGRGYGVLMDILLGLIGGVVGGWIFSAFGIHAYGFVGTLTMCTVGAVSLVGAAHALRNAA
jgi:uncharacterized membrane protein YeaQ/YmgE (transglycosylase-associated protein family)